MFWTTDYCLWKKRKKKNRIRGQQRHKQLSQGVTENKKFFFLLKFLKYTNKIRECLFYRACSWVLIYYSDYFFSCSGKRSHPEFYILLISHHFTRNINLSPSFFWVCVTDWVCNDLPEPSIVKSRNSSLASLNALFVFNLFDLIPLWLRPPLFCQTL